MFLERVRSEIVAHVSYFIGSGSQAAVVDPRRDCGVYLDIARREGMAITFVFETHRNEDYVVGSRELASLTGAEIYHGPWPIFKYGRTLKDCEEFTLGSLKIKAIHTPGHTPGCMSFYVTDMDSGEQPVLVFTGDTLFVNEVGRTDFGGLERRREWSENLYSSIFDKLLPLGDHVIVYPAHGAGSVCGLGIAERELTTLGLERLQNPILQLSREEFVEHKTREHHEYAPYFRLMEKYNVEGAPFIGFGPSIPALSTEDFQSRLNAGALVVDTRSGLAFSSAHIKGSYNIPTGLLSYTGWLIPFEKPMLLIVDDETNLEYVSLSLLRIGYDYLAGYLKEGVSLWVNNGLPFESLPLLSAPQLKTRLDSDERPTLLDVRSVGEWEDGHLPHAKNVYVGHLAERLAEVPDGVPTVTVCNTGARASIAASILLRSGKENVLNLLGGMQAWEACQYPIETE